MEAGSKITYETLFDILRNEKNREELQSMDKSFFEDLVQYIQDKQQLIKDNQPNELFSSIEREKTQKQLDNVKRLVRELYERREKKIINMAVINSRTGGVLDTSPLIGEERVLFDKIARILESHREDILYRLLCGEAPQLRAVQDEKPKASVEEPKRTENDTVLLRFIEPVPKFLGKELEIFGPFEEDDIANLPRQIAEILINKGRAEKIQG